MEAFDNKIINLIKSQDYKDPAEYIDNLLKDYYIQKLNEDIYKCDKCSISQYGFKSLFYGNKNAKLLFVGESIPSDFDFSEYNIDSGYIGDTLKEIFENTDLKKQDAAYINAVNCYTCRKHNDGLLHRSPLVEERNNCNNYLKRAVNILNPKVIISLGSVPTNCLLKLINKKDASVNITQFRGTEFYFYDSIVIPTFNPMHFIESKRMKTEEEINVLKQLFIDDVLKAIDYLYK